MPDKPPKKPTPPWIGLAAMADLWLWGALFLYAPSYLDIDGVLAVLLYAVGFACLILSLAGALTELGKLWKSEGLNYWGVSLIFLVPAVLLILAVNYHRVPGTLEPAARVAVLGLFAVGGAMFFQGIPYFFWGQGPQVQTPGQVPPGTERNGGPPGESRVNRKAAANAIVALLALATAVVTLIEKILR